MSKSEGKAVCCVEKKGKGVEQIRAALLWQRKGIAKKHFDTICNGCAVCSMYGKGIDTQRSAEAKQSIFERKEILQ